MTRRAASGEINSMSADERGQLVHALRKGIEMRQWEDLVRHRTFHSILQGYSTSDYSYSEA
jgi:hypothetical protein